MIIENLIQMVLGNAKWGEEIGALNFNQYSKGLVVTFELSLLFFEQLV